MFGKEKIEVVININVSGYCKEEAKRREIEKWLVWIKEKSQEHGIKYVLEIRC